MKTFYLKHFFKTSLLMLTMLLGTSSWGQTELPFSFNGNRASIATTTGLSHSGLGTDYADSNTKLKFDSTGDYLTLNFNGDANELTFTIRFNGSGTFNGTYNVLGSSDGTNFNVNLFSLGSHAGNTNIDYSISSIPTSVKYIRWIYTNKTSGNIGLGNINLTASAVTTPTLSISTEEITGLNYIFGNGPSDAQSFTLSGANLDGSENVMIGLDGFEVSDFEISFDAESGYGHALFIDNYDGTPTTIYTRLKSGKAVSSTYADFIEIYNYYNTDVFQVTVSGEVTPLPSTPVVTDAELTGNVGVAFEYQVVASYEPDTYFISSDALPTGLSLDTATGLITGTPTAVGEYLTGIKATNLAGISNEGIFIFEIAKGTQTLADFTDQNKYDSDEPFTFPATTNAGLTVNYESDDASIATVSGNTITITGIGTTIIWAMSDGGANWEDYLEMITLTVTEAPEAYAGVGTFEKITSVEDLTDGYYVIVGNFTELNAMTNNHNGTYLAREVVTPTGDIIENPNTSIVWYIESNGNEYTIYNDVTAKYVSYTGGSNNIQVVDDVTANNQRWTVTYTNNNFLFNNAQLTTRRLQYNTNNGQERFAAYTGSQKDLLLYKLQTSSATEVTWTTNNTWSNTTGPTFNDDVIIEGTLAIDGFTSFDAKSLTITGDLTILEEGVINLKGAVTNNGNFTIENGGNLIQTTDYTGANSGSMLVKKNSSLIKHLDYTIWSSPVAGQGLQAFSPLTLAYRIYSYDTPSDTWVTTAGNFEAGRGYMFRAPNDFITTPYIYDGEFNGVANNGDVTVNFADVGTYQDLGNPYPSNISAAQFWAANPGTGTLYFWTNINAWDNSTQSYVANNWATYSGAGGVPSENGSKTPTDVIEVGQGFVVETNGILNSVTFDNAMRTSTSGVFFRTATTDKHRMWLNFSNENGGLNQILIGYMDDATNEFDLGIDSKMFSYNGSALYSLIDNDESKFTIQGRPMPFNPYDVVNLGLKANEAGTYTVSIANVDGMFAEDQAIFLNDNLTQTQHNLKDGDYTFVSAEGTFADRFEVTYTASMSVTNPALENAWVVYNQNNNFNIQTQSFELKDVVVYDMLGRVIYQSAAEGTTHSIANLSSNGVMIVKITTTDGQEFSRKVAK